MKYTVLVPVVGVAVVEMEADSESEAVEKARAHASAKLLFGIEGADAHILYADAFDSVSQGEEVIAKYIRESPKYPESPVDINARARLA